MKKVIALIVALLISAPLFARVSVICDVIYEKSFAEWSEYYRREVEFVSGQELGLILDGNKLFAIIWYSQTQCSVIQMEYDGVFVPSRIDFSFIDIFLGFDLLNEGRLGVEKDGEKERKWRIYGKDDMSFMIDPRFDEYPYNKYNSNIREYISQGVEVVRRSRPKEEIKYAGWDKGVIVWHYDPCYIIQTNTCFVVALRSAVYYWSGRANDGDLVMGYFSQKGKTNIDDIDMGTGMSADVVFLSSEYKACADWVRENVAFD